MIDAPLVGEEAPPRDAGRVSEPTLALTRSRLVRLQEFFVPTGSDGHPSPSLLNWTTLILLAILAVGLAVRVWAAKHLSPHIDEPASLLPAFRTAEKGWPQLPSGVPYLQGATVSYILAPIIKLGGLSIEHFRPLRLVSVAFGTGVIYFVFRLGVTMTRRVWIGLVVAGLIMLDPVSVEWSAHIRMYAPLEMLAVVITLLFYQSIIHEPSRKQLALLAVVFWLGIFTHIAIALFLPPMALVTLYVYRDRLWKDRKDIVVCGIACGLAPITLTLLNKFLSPYHGASTSGGPFSFVGDHLVRFDQVFNPNLAAWNQLFYRGNVSGIMPALFFLANGLLIGGAFLWRQNDRQESNERLAVTTLLLFNWLAIALVAAFTIEGQGRYLLHVQPLGFLLFVLGAREFIKAAKGFSLRTLRGAALRIAAAALILLQFVNVQTGLAYLVDHPNIDADFIAPAIYVKQHHQPGQAIISVVDQVVYVTMHTTDNVYFLAGQTGSARSTRYSYLQPDGVVLDFWLGVPALSGSTDLCRVLYQSPGGWILIDQSRLNAGWGFRGNMATVITGAADIKFTAVNATYAMQIKHVANWSSRAQSICDSALGVMPPPDPSANAGS